MELQDDLMDDADDAPNNHEDSMEPPMKSLRRYTRSAEYWAKRASGELGPMGSLQEGVTPTVVHLHPDSPEHGESKRRRVTIADPPEQSVEHPSVLETPTLEEPDSDIDSYIEPSLADEQEFNGDMVPSPEGDPSVSVPADETTDVATEAPATLPADAPENEDAVQLDNAVNTAVPNDDDDLLVTASRNSHQVLEVSMNLFPEDITENPLCLWSVLEDCFQVSPPAAKQRRVEVSFRKLNPEDKQLFTKAMQKEWNSWIENKVTSLCKSKGIDPDRIIRARWVLVWKKSSDPDDKGKTPKARLVLVGWQDPELLKNGWV